MKFDFCIGNPPYQEEAIGENATFFPPVYDKFLDAAFEIADKVEMIHPARFLSNAGNTSKDWNKKMLNDKHYKVLEYEADSGKIFSNTDIKGGVAITYRDSKKDFGPIGVFTAFEELNGIMNKVVKREDFVSFSSIVSSRTAYRLTEAVHHDFPFARYKEDNDGNNVGRLTKGHDYDMSTNIFELLPEVFLDNNPGNGEYAKMIGLVRQKRTYRYALKKYISGPENFEHYKVLMPSANGSGAIGEVLSTPLIGEPLIGGTETFISIGCFDVLDEAEALLKYVKTKFARVLLGILKITQHITPEKWKYVPLQDYTSKSDIDWTQSISNIDQQLYKKYDLSNEEINFIETHVKEME